MIDAFLSEDRIEEQRQFLSRVIEKVRDQSTTDASKHEWRQILETYQILIGLSDYPIACAIFFISLAGSNPLQLVVFRKEPTPERRLFFRDRWLPYVKKLTEVLRQTGSFELEETYKSYSHTLRQSWRLQALAPHTGLPNLDSVECIHLVHLGLPQDEHQPSDQS